MASSVWAVDVRNDPFKELFKIPEEVLLICSGDFKQKTKDTTQEDITFYLERGHEAGWIKGSHSLIRNEDNYPLIDIEVSQNEFKAKFKNDIGKPRVVVSRITAILEIRAWAYYFSGKCKKFDTSKKRF